MSPRAYPALLALCLASCLGAAENTPAAPDFRAAVSEVTETRSTGNQNSSCRLEFSFTGDVASDALCVRSIQLTKAVDGNGRNLLLPTPSNHYSNLDLDRRTLVLKGNTSVRNPSRNTATIKELSGKVELFSPSDTNGGLVTLADALKTPGANLANDSLKASKIEVSYLTKDTFAAKKKELEEQQAKNIPAGMSGMANAFRSIFSGFIPSDAKNSVCLLILDPEKRVLEVALTDADGKALQRRGRNTMGSIWQLNYDEAPPSDARLVLYVASPEALKTYTFTVENVALP